MMMLGSSDPAAYDMTAVVALACLGLVLLAGVLTGHHWPPTFPMVVRRAAALLAVFVVVFVLFVTPTRSGIVGAGRMLTLWPALGVDVFLFAMWAWREGQL